METTTPSMEMTAAEVLRVVDALDAVGIRVGITGGWGVDALLGRQTRPHLDVDLGLSSGEVESAIAALARLGYRIALDQRPARVELRSKTGAVDLHPIVWGGSGHGIQAAFDDVVIDYPPGSLDGKGVIAGRSVACGTPALQLAFHRSAEPRLVDRVDMRLLSSELGIEMPPGYE
jgi:lincosamide nucleotidyltransferase A/C/D/E